MCIRDWCIAGLVALDYFSGSFVHNYYMVVFVENSHCNLVGSKDIRDIKIFNVFKVLNLLVLKFTSYGRDCP